MPEVGQTYTPDNKYDQRVQQLRSQVGDNPEAIRQAAGQQMIQNDQQLQESVQGQQAGVSALQQLAEYDQQLAGQVRQANQQQMQTDTARRAATTQMGAINPNDAAATIASGPVDFNVQQFGQTYGPAQNAILSPFVASGMVSGQAQAAQGTYDLASQLRGSRERAIGSEADAIARIAASQIEKERLEAERKKAEELAKYESARDYAMLYGGTVRNPLTGQDEKYESPEEKARREATEKQIKDQSVVEKLRTRIGKTGKSLIEEVTDGLGNFSDILRENPDLSQEEVYELARINTNKYGAFAETPEQLREMGLSPEIMDQLGIPRAGGVAKSDPQEILNKAYAIPGAAEIIGKAGNQATQEAIARQILQAGSIEAYKKAQGATGGNVESLKEKYGMTADDSKKVMDSIRLITSLKDVQNALNEAIGGKQTGRLRDLAIGTTGFLSQFAGTGGTDAQSRARAKVNDLQAQIRNNMFGSALTPQEIEQANKILPTVGTQEQDNLNRLNAKIDQKTNDILSTLRAYGVSDEEINALIGSATGVAGQAQPAAVTMQSPDGKTYQIDPKEAVEAENNGWRRL